MLKESNFRKGFFENAEYTALKNALPEYLRPIATFGYHSGWRKSEILGLTWDRVDLREGVIRLDPGETKNEEGRTIYLNEEVMEEMKALHGKRQLGCPYVFHRNGKPIMGFRKAWGSACIKVGLCEVLKDEEGNPVVIKTMKRGEKVVTTLAIIMVTFYPEIAYPIVAAFYWVKHNPKDIFESALDLYTL
jgi:Phage integrase family